VAAEFGHHVGPRCLGEADRRVERSIIEAQQAVAQDAGGREHDVRDVDSDLLVVFFGFEQGFGQRARTRRGLFRSRSVAPTR